MSGQRFSVLNILWLDLRTLKGIRPCIIRLQPITEQHDVLGFNVRIESVTWLHLTPVICNKQQVHWIYWNAQHDIYRILPLSLCCIVIFVYLKMRRGEWTQIIMKAFSLLDQSRKAVGAEKIYKLDYSSFESAEQLKIISRMKIQHK